MNRRAALGLIAFASLLGAALFGLSTDKAPAPAAKSAAAPASAVSEPAPTVATAAPSPSVVPAGPSRQGRFDLADDGTPLPPLPSTAPERVRVGVALFAYSGAQGVPPGVRSPQAALELARAAIASSAGDFSKILAKADPGSRDDVGWIRRGILERRVEQQVFLLEKGASTREPVDTPRGYWVVLRNQ